MRVDRTVIVFVVAAVCIWSILAVRGSRYAFRLAEPRVQKVRAIFAVGFWVSLAITFCLYIAGDPEWAWKFPALVAIISLLLGCYGSKSARNPKLDLSLSLFEEVFATRFIYLGLELALATVGIWTVDLLSNSRFKLHTNSLSAPLWLWGVYAIALLMARFESAEIVRFKSERPGLLRGRSESVFLLVRLTTTYGILIVLWRTSGLAFALLWFSGYFIFQLLTVRWAYNRELRRQFDSFIASKREESQSNNMFFDESQFTDEAMNFARVTVMGNLRG